MIYKKVAKRVDPKSSHHKEKIFFLPYLYEMMDVYQTYCGHHFTIYVSQTFVTYSLNYTVMYVNYFSIKLEKMVIYNSGSIA